MCSMGCHKFGGVLESWYEDNMSSVSVIIIGLFSLFKCVCLSVVDVRDNIFENNGTNNFQKVGYIVKASAFSL